MFKKAIWYLFIYVLSSNSINASWIDIAEPEKDLDLIAKLLHNEEDPCASEKCHHGGTCVATNYGFKCICEPPYFGETCNENPCIRNPCQNNGKCELDKHAREGFKCICKSPFRGETCNLEPCSPNPCENDGKCKLIGDSFNCTCKNPYHGSTCELGPCAPNPCKNNGECEEDGENFICICQSPFTGHTCEQSPCAPNPCENNGQCYITEEDDFACRCKESFSGKICEKGPCVPNPCQNGGECSFFGNSTSCLCQSAFFGKHCEKDLCSKMPCKNNGKCKIVGKSFECECKKPFIGKICEEDLCSRNPCKNNGICKLEGNTFKCECNPPYTGKQCQTGPCSSNPCLNNGGCKVKGNTFNCECVPPYKGKHCEMGPCSSQPCLNNGGCIVIGLNFKCECEPPYIGDQCQFRNSTDPDILMSTSSNFMKTSASKSYDFSEMTNSYNQTSSDLSTNTIEVVTMTTDVNFTISTTHEKGSCEQDSDCFNGGTCRSKDDTTVCDCASDFGGIRCEISLPCISLDQSCRLINAVCVLVDNHPICECPNGTLYHRKSGLCEDICDPRKCQHGKCEIIGKTYKCNCDKGYTGNHCDEKERSHHENFVPWFIVIASIGLFICVLLIAMFCFICQIKTSVTSS